MSLHHIAQHLAAQGRQGDTMLVHMNPKEVAGLQALAEHKGTSLTINPHTGLPEALSLGDLNPFRIVQGKGEIGESGLGSMLIGAALMAAGVPAAVFGPGALAGAGGAALLTGGAAALMGGGAKGALSQGLGAYGGASMYGAMNSAAAPTPTSPSGGPVPPAPNAPVQAGPVPTAPTGPTGPLDTTAGAFNQPTPTTPQPLVDTSGDAFNQPRVASVTPTTTAPLTDAQVDVGLGKAGQYTPVGEKSYMDATKAFVKENAWPLAGLGALALTQEKPKGVEPADKIPPGKIRPYIYDPKTGALTQLRPYDAPGYAAGGMPVEEMSNANAVGANTGYPQADITGHAYATPWQTPVSQNVVTGSADTGVNRMNGQMLATGGLTDLGGYSDGGRLLKGPGDGVSDSIPAMIGGKQPARLADGEFVVPARIVSELGNGSTEAGARKLYAMMDRVQKARGKTTGKNKVAANSRADKYLPA